MLNVHQLNVFVIAAETLNFTETAKRLHLTQSSVSQHIKSLETQIGMELFVRKGRTLVITDAGEILMPLAQDIVDGSVRAIEQMELLKTEVHGHILIGCNTATGKYMLPNLLAEFHKRFPLVKVTCSMLSAIDTINELSKGEIHFALTNMKDKGKEHSEFHLFTQEPIVLIAPKNHRWSQIDEIFANELYDEPFIMRDSQSDLFQRVKLGLTVANIDIDKLNIQFTMDASESIVLAVQEGVGCGFVSKTIVDKFCSDSVEVIRVNDLSMNLEIYFGRQTIHPATAAQVVFWDFITHQYPRMHEMTLSLN